METRGINTRPRGTPAAGGSAARAQPGPAAPPGAGASGEPRARPALGPRQGVGLGDAGGLAKTSPWAGKLRLLSASFPAVVSGRFVLPWIQGLWRLLGADSPRGARTRAALRAPERNRASGPGGLRAELPGAGTAPDPGPRTQDRAAPGATRAPRPAPRGLGSLAESGGRAQMHGKAV